MKKHAKGDVIPSWKLISKMLDLYSSRNALWRHEDVMSPVLSCQICFSRIIVRLIIKHNLK